MQYRSGICPRNAHADGRQTRDNHLQLHHLTRPQPHQHQKHDFQIAQKHRFSFIAVAARAQGEPHALCSCRLLLLADILHIENYTKGTLASNLVICFVLSLNITGSLMNPASTPVICSVLSLSTAPGLTNPASGKELLQAFPVKQIPRLVARGEHLQECKEGQARLATRYFTTASLSPFSTEVK